MTGKILAIATLVIALVMGVAIYYLQIYGYYDEVAYRPGMVTLVPKDGTTPEPLEAGDFQAIDADSSPLRFRACFTLAEDLPDLAAEYQPYPDPVPLNGPGWFDCYDAGRITEALEAGTARAFLAQKNIDYGVDRVIAVFDDGRAYAWHQLNNCGETDYAGNPVGEACPPQKD